MHRKTIDRKKQSFLYYSNIQILVCKFVRQISDKCSFYRYLLYSVIFRMAVYKKRKEKTNKQVKFDVHGILQNIPVDGNVYSLRNPVLLFLIRCKNVQCMTVTV